MKKIERKKPGPQATGKGEQVNVRLLPDLLAAIDKQVANKGLPSRAAAIREILVSHLKSNRLI